MAFHTFLGFYCGREYRRYKDRALATRRQSMHAIAVRGISNTAFDAAKVPELTESSTSLDQDDILSPEEFKYPRARRINKIVNIAFICLFAAFNVVYWSIAAGVYLSD